MCVEGKRLDEVSHPKHIKSNCLLLDWQQNPGLRIMLPC